MALAQGSGVYVPPKPKAVQQNVAARAATVPYGYDPLAQSGQSWQVQDPMNGMYPGTQGQGQSGAELLAQYQRAQLGPSFRRSFGYGTDEEKFGDVFNMVSWAPGGPGAIGKAGEAPGILGKVLGAVRGLTGTGKKAPAQQLAEYAMTQEAITKAVGKPGMQRGGFLKSPSDIEQGREATRTVHGQIPGALDILLHREQESMPFLNQLMNYSNRAHERNAPDVLMQRGSEGLVHNPGVEKVGKKGPGTLRPSSGSPEGRMLDEIISRYGDVGGSQLADRPGGFVKPLWERGDTPQGDVISRAKGATHPDNEVFDFLQGGKPQFESGGPGQDMSAEAYGIQHVPRQVKNANVRKAVEDAAMEQKQAKMWEPTYKMVDELGKAFGSPVVPARTPHFNPFLDQIINRARATNKWEGSGGFANSPTAYGMDPKEFLAMLIRRSIH